MAFAALFAVRLDISVAGGSRVRLYWADNPDQTSTVYREESAPTMPPARDKYETWFFFPVAQPDGICMNCRKRRGLMDPIGGYYSCEECRAICDDELATYIKLRAVAA